MHGMYAVYKLLHELPCSHAVRGITYVYTVWMAGTHGYLCPTRIAQYVIVDGPAKGGHVAKMFVAFDYDFILREFPSQLLFIALIPCDNTFNFHLLT